MVDDHENAPPPPPTGALAALFSSPTLAALRYALTSVGTLAALFGVVALSPQQVDHIIAIAQQLGVTLGAIAALLGIVIPPAMAAIGALKSTNAAKVKDLIEGAGVKVQVGKDAPPSVAIMAIDPTVKNVAPIPGQEAAVAKAAEGVK